MLTEYIPKIKTRPIARATANISDEELFNKGTTRGVLWKKVLLEISQNSQENTRDLRPATLLKKRLWHRCFLVNFVKFPRTPFLTQQLWWCFCVNYCCEDLCLKFLRGPWLRLWLNYKFWRKHCCSWKLYICFVSFTFTCV